MISPAQEAEIKRLHFAEKWPIGTIASQLGLHHDAVERVIQQDGLPRAAPDRPSRIIPFVTFIQETFQRYPDLTASRLYVMCCERGYRGSPDHFRHLVRPYRPRPRAEAYLRLKTLPGEQAQVDWGHFGKILVGQSLRILVAFVMVLSWSRKIFVRFFLGQQTENFLRGHEAAFQAWQGLPRVLLYDNLKSAVLERVGDAIHFNPTLLSFAGHYRFEARPVAVARGNEKGRVERAIRYVRESFFAARPWKDLADLNAKAVQWCEGQASDRPWVEDKSRTVRDAFEEEKSHLMPLPATPFPLEERREATVGKTPYVRFDGNDYSVPHTLVRRTLTVLATEVGVRILDGNQVVASHRRSYERGHQVEDPAHIQALVADKERARDHRGIDRLSFAVPAARGLLERMAERGQNLGSATARLLKMLDLYGAESLGDAIQEALEKDVPHPHAVRHILEREREARGQPPPIQVVLPDNPAVREIAVQPHSLESYDVLAETQDSHPVSESEPGPLPEIRASNLQSNEINPENNGDNDHDQENPGLALRGAE